MKPYRALHAVLYVFSNLPDEIVFFDGEKRLLMAEVPHGAGETFLERAEITMSKLWSAHMGPCRLCGLPDPWPLYRRN